METTNEIDIVYNYVNGNDPEWLSKRAEYLQQDKNNSTCRFIDNDELKYNLRSLEKYANWIRNVYIVVDSQLPEWLNLENPRVHIVHHSDIMPEDILPCYNSNVIESYICEIEGLSEIFIYANDDMMFGNHVSKDFFVKNGKPVIRIKNEKLYRKKSYYTKILKKSKALIESLDKKHYYPWHNMDVFSRTAMRDCILEFQDKFDTSRKNRFRKESDIQKALFHYYMMDKELCETVVYNLNSRKAKCVYYGLSFLFPSKYFDFFFSPIDRMKTWKWIIITRSPKCICINDSEKTTDEGRQAVKKYYQKKLPKKSEFEK